MKTNVIQAKYLKQVQNLLSTTFDCQVKVNGVLVNTDPSLYYHELSDKLYPIMSAYFDEAYGEDYSELLLDESIGHTGLSNNYLTTDSLYQYTNKLIDQAFNEMTKEAVAKDNS